MTMTWAELILATAAATVGVAILLVGLRYAERRAFTHALSTEAIEEGPVFLFENRTLIDATPDAQAMISAHVDHMDDLDAVLHVLSPHFPDLQTELAGELPDQIRIESATHDQLWIDIRKHSDKLRIAVKATHRADKLSASDLIANDVQLSELTMLRNMTQHNPQLIWQEDSDGRLLWANQSYLKFCDAVHRPQQPDDAAAWPNTPLFPDLHGNLSARENNLRRLSVTLPEKRAEQWFDITSVKQGTGFLHFATDANAIVRADHERRQFVQTLSKTFADLSIGLAIFNKRRELTMFNPALLDMTNLPVEFLSRRPLLDSVLDRLRETRMMPEPKNYANWREHFTALETAAKNGRYTETWNLPEGQTYRVTGRPHPDGAFAFLFEDISAEISLTRRFRTDIETGQAVLDTLPDAIAVFSSAGTMVMSNAAYKSLWGDPTEQGLSTHDLPVAMRAWQTHCAPTAIWAELRNFIQKLGARVAWSDRVVLDDGRQLRCHANPISGGMTMVRFAFAPPKSQVIHKLTAPDETLLAARR